jgi:hypothetical protein
MRAMIRKFLADLFAGWAEALRTGGKGEER